MSDSAAHRSQEELRRHGLDSEPFPMHDASAAMTPPRNLTHCCECGCPLKEPVTAAEALQWFPSLDEANFMCSSCSSQWGDDE